MKSPRISLLKETLANQCLMDSHREFAVNLQSSVYADADLDSNPDITHFSTENLSSGSYTSQNSSTAGSSLCENNLLTSTSYGSQTSYGSINSTVGDFPHPMALLSGYTEESKYHCTHGTHPKDNRPAFKSEKELKRHERKHNPHAKRWHCGCCQNLGDNFEASTRKDKVRDHMRLIHEKPKSEDKKNKGILCPVDSCDTLFTVASCLEEHLLRVHPSQPQSITSQTTNGKTCDCKERAESQRFQEGLESRTKKHRAGSPLESTEKRGRYDAVSCQISEMVPLPDLVSQRAFLPAYSLPTTGSFTLAPIPEGEWLTINDSFPDPANEVRNFLYTNMPPQLDVASWGAATSLTDPYSIEAANISRNHGMTQNLPPSDHCDLCPLDTYAQSPPYQSSSIKSNPADFLAICKNKAFQVLASRLRQIYDYNPCSQFSPITYNPEKETITLNGSSDSQVRKVMIDLQVMIEKFSIRCGTESLMGSDSSTSRVQDLGTPNGRINADPATAKVFPIRPKEHRPQVQLWFKSILPVLPDILSERLGGNYSASLVRRGEIDLRAKPCIQIESSCLPAAPARRIIRDFISEICKKENIPPISVHFTEGSVKKLNGEQEEDDHDDQMRADLQRLEFNYSRPFSKPGMGASVGLLCSNSLCAFLGGYILVDGEKFLLTSKHFVSTSQEPANRNFGNADSDTLISPPRHELNKIKNNLIQSRRDLDGQLNKQMREDYGDTEIPEDSFNDPEFLNPNTRSIMTAIDDVKSLLAQVSKPPVDYAVGTSIRFGLGQRTGLILEYSAMLASFPNSQRSFKYEMDWALFDSKNQRAGNGENRHKYQSNQDAMNDNYIEERDHMNRPGDVCHETCSAQTAHSVYYVGQRSKHRSGVANVPMLVCIDSVKTDAWGILDSNGENIAYSDVAGDSGAWVIRKEGNMLMGQVVYHSQGQVLFIPINDIFADIGESCGAPVSLPLPPPRPGQNPSATPAIPLCSEPETPPVRPYLFLTCPDVALAASSESRTLDPSVKLASTSDTRIERDRCPSDLSFNSLSPPPSLTNSPQSSATTPDYPKSPRSNVEADIANEPADFEEQKLLLDSHPTVLDGSTMSDTPDLSLKRQKMNQPVELGIYTFTFNDHSISRINSSNRVPTWPIDVSSRGTKAQRRSDKSLRRHTKRFLARSLFSKVADFARTVEDVTDSEPLSSPCQHEYPAAPVPESISKRQNSRSLNSCSIVASSGRKNALN